MKTLQITEENATRLYKDAAPEFKTMLNDTFGENFFKRKITDRIKTYEDACREIGEIPVNEAKMKSSGFTSDEIAYRKIKTIAKALNERWQPDWNDQNQFKYFPWFELGPSYNGSYCGLAYSHSNYVRSISDSYLGSRLVFKNKELAEYAGQQFVRLYEAFMI